MEDVTSPQEPVAPPEATLPRRSFNPYERNSIDITLVLKNYGSGGDNITTEEYHSNGQISVTVSPSSTYMEKDEIKFINVAIEVPVDLDPGVYTLLINASSEDPEFVTRTVTLEFEIENYDVKIPPIPTIVDPKLGDVVLSDYSVLQGSNISFKLEIENNGSRPLVSVYLRGFDNYTRDGIPSSWDFINISTPPIVVGDRLIVGKPPFNDDNPPLYWRANEPGDHTLEFWVYYGDQSNSGNDISRINITVTVPPEIVRIEPASGSTFKEGENITFRATATDGDGDELTYTWMEGDEVFGSGAEFNYSGFAPGEHTIALVVDDGMGMTSQNITITIRINKKAEEPGFLAIGALFTLMIMAVLVLLYKSRK
jgi:hypothetical protein